MMKAAADAAQGRHLASQSTSLDGWNSLRCSPARLRMLTTGGACPAFGSARNCSASGIQASRENWGRCLRYPGH